jgi:hypothetical protein
MFFKEAISENKFKDYTNIFVLHFRKILLQVSADVKMP